LPDFRHDVQVALQIVAGAEGGKEDFSGLKEVAEVGPRVSLTGITGAVRVEGTGVGAVLGVLDNDFAFGGEEPAVAGVAGGEDAIHHIDAAGDVFGEFMGHADSHGVARAVFGEEGFGGFHHFEAQRARLADGESSYSIAIGVEFEQALGAFGS
jgi:hypothetical protein